MIDCNIHQLWLAWAGSGVHWKYYYIMLSMNYGRIMTVHFALDIKWWGAVICSGGSRNLVRVCGQVHLATLYLESAPLKIPISCTKIRAEFWIFGEIIWYSNNWIYVWSIYSRSSFCGSYTLEWLLTRKYIGFTFTSNNRLTLLWSSPGQYVWLHTLIWKGMS